MKRTTTIALACILGVLSALAQEEAETPVGGAAVRPAGGGLIILDGKGLPPPPPPLFFAADSEAAVRVSHDAITQDVVLNVRVLQGRPEVITLSFTGAGEIVSVTGEEVEFWAVRQGVGDEASDRFLEIRPKLPNKEEADGLKGFQARITARQDLDELPREVDVLVLGPGEAVGYSGRVDLIPDDTVSFEVSDQSGWMAVNLDEDAGEARRLQTTSANRLRLRLEARGAAALPVELAQVRLEGSVDPAAQSVHFTLTGEARVRSEAGGKLPILSGQAALSELPEEAGYEVRLVTPEKGVPYYEMVFAGEGEFPIQLGFDARLRTRGEWSSFDFTVPASVIVPLRLTGLPTEVRFDGTQAVFPTQAGEEWLGFLPPSGHAATAWRPGKDEEEGKLFFSTGEKTEIGVSAGLLRQVITLEVNILQGKLNEVAIDVFGEGEVLAVEGPNVLGWTVTPGEGGARRLTIPVSQALVGQAQLVIRSQTPVGEFPVTVKPLRLAPVDSVRHSGSLRLGNLGAVRLQLGAIQGMTQLSPSQFPGEVSFTKNATQVYVYRIPTAGYDYEIQADQILPEVNVSQITIYHLGEADRRIDAAIELDIREAALREWELQIPEDHAVVSVQGAEIADHLLGTEVTNGTRSLKILFGKMISGRHVVHLQLEKNEAPAAGDWVLPPLTFPQAKSVRGHLGVTATAGYRLTTGTTERLSELPLTQFPVQNDNLQQAYRLREPGWAATVTVEALGQSVQADVFHLYSLKEGMVYGSVLLNYYVVGAPVNSWRLQVPEAVGNVAIDGEDVQTWRREGGELTVTLHEPALGPSTLLLTFEQPMSVDGGSLILANVAPLDVQGERGFIQVVSPYQVQHEITQVSANLLPLEAMELPAEFRLLTSAPSLAAYQYGARPIDLAMNIQWFEPGETVDQVVDYARLSSEVSRDGQVATEMQLHVKTRGRQALRLRLPAGATLWDAHVDGKAVNARTDGNATVIPLTASTDPNHHVLVVVRMGQAAAGKRAARPTLSAPAAEAPMMISEWKVRGERGRLLLPRGDAAAQLVAPVLTETGYEWLQRRGRWIGGLLVVGFAFAGAILGRARRSRFLPFLGGLFLLGAVFVCGVLVKEGMDHRRVNTLTLELVAPVITPGQPLEVELSQVPVWRAMIHPLGALLCLLGAFLFKGGERFDLELVRKLSRVLAVTLIGAGILAQRFGAPMLFTALGVWLLGVWCTGCWREWRANCLAYRKEKEAKKAAAEENPPDADPPAPPVVATPLWMALGIGISLWGATADSALAAELTADQLTQTWRIEGQRLFGELEVSLSGKAGDRLELLKAPAVLTAFTPEDEEMLRVARRVVEGGVAYDVVLESDGEGKATATFELALSDPLSRVDFPTGSAALHQVTVDLDRAGWEITSSAAVRTTVLDPGEAGQSRVTMLLGLAGRQRLNLAPRKRDLAAEASQFYAEVDQLYIPRPGVIDGRHRISLRPSQGRVREMSFVVPAGFTVSDVLLEDMRTWRFDPETRALRVELETAQARPFRLAILTQQGVSGLPADVTLDPLRVNDAAGEVGMLALAFGPDAQPDTMTAQGMSAVNLEDFDPAMLGKLEGETDPLVLHRVYRYGADAASVALRVTAVEPEVRMSSRQTLSLGEERLVLSVDLTTTVTRAGLFQLRFPVPAGLDVEAISGSHLDHWSEVTENNTRLVVLHLNGRSMGELTFAITLSGASPGAQANWVVPRFTLENVARATGQLVISPDLGIRAQAVSRRNVSQLDTRRLARKQPGTLAFQLLQDDWELQLRIEQLDPWITAQALQEVTLREGQTRTRLAIHYQIENAAVKALRLNLPGLTDTDENSVHATGDAISDVVRIPEQDDLWEIRFQRGMLGKVLVAIDFQQPADRSVSVEAIPPVTLVDVRQATHWLAVRSSGRLDLALEDPDRRWQLADWSTVPSELVNEREPSVPRLCVRAVAPDQPLQIRVERHAVAEALKLRVAKGRFRSIVSAAGEQVTKVVLTMEVSEKSPLRVTLPNGASLFNAFVNRQSVALVRETAGGNTYLFYVFPQEDSNRAQVTFAYGIFASSRGSSLQLTGPLLDLPLQDITWEVVLPNGYVLKDHDGDLNLQEEARPVRFDVDQYLAVHREIRQQQAQNANALLEKANYWLKEGQQDKALEALQNAANSPSLDAASNEDARVQLRQLQTEQAVLGLNTRRQLLALENIIETPAFARNEQLEQAANLNPLLRGQLNYDPTQVDDLLRGNTAEENSALKRMAGRLVSQQSEADPGLRGIDVTLPARGDLVTFRRSVQVNSAAPLQLKLKVAPVTRVHGGFIAAVFVLLGLLAVVGAKSWRSS